MGGTLRIRVALLVGAVVGGLVLSPMSKAAQVTGVDGGVAAIATANGLAGYVRSAAGAVGTSLVAVAPPVGDPVSGLVAAATHADSLRRQAVAAVTPQQWARAGAAGDAIVRLLDPRAVHSAADVRFDQAALNELTTAADLPIDQKAMWQATLEISVAVDRLLNSLHAGYPISSKSYPTPLGEVVIDSGPAPCDSTYTERAFIVIDTCGNDTYSSPAGGADGLSAVPTAVVVDTDGDDHAAEAESTPSIGAAVNGGLAVFVDQTGNDQWGIGSGSLIGGVGSTGGLGFMADLAGNDSYAASGFLAPGGKFGSGQLAGVGLLVDAQGNDTYSADTFQQGSGWFGDAVGILADLAGDDSYNDISTYSQGSGGVGGLGVLYDNSGSDHYNAYSVFEQGGAACGGIGVLLDGAGDDQFVEGAWFSQGAAATGLAATGCGDEGGSGLADRALALLPPEARDLIPGVVRGALDELPLGAVGVLADLAGNDSYQAGSFQQGVSVGSAAGLLLDGGGDDTYKAGFCSQAFGSAGPTPCYQVTPSGPGVAVLADSSGDDSYATDWSSPTTNQGAGYGGSIVVLFDGDGTDAYDSGVVDGGGFQSRGDNGLAIDLVPTPDDPTDYELPGAPTPPTVPSAPAVPDPSSSRYNFVYLFGDTSFVYAYVMPNGTGYAQAYDYSTGKLRSSRTVSITTEPKMSAVALSIGFADCRFDAAYVATHDSRSYPSYSYSYGKAAAKDCLTPVRYDGSASSYAS